jgi:Pin2-interacting protein X1
MKLPAGYVAGEGVRKATAYGGFGEKMLQKMGWEKGLGLGKNKDGIASAIEVKKKEDNSGVGCTPYTMFVIS